MDLLVDETSLSDTKIRVGLFPGSFNPPHAGHIDLAERSKFAVGLDRILFYANSFNVAKRAQFVSITHRKSMLDLMIDPSYMSIIPDAFYQEAPDDAWILGAYSFSPLIERLQRQWPAHYEIWMLRGGDYFTRSDGHASAYPRELWHLPHVVGSRGLNANDLDLSMLSQSICVETLTLSSSALRAQSDRGNHAGDGIDPRLLTHADRPPLYRQPMPQRGGVARLDPVEPRLVGSARQPPTTG